MEGEPRKMGVIVLILPTGAGEGAKSSRCELGLGSTMVAATWRFPELSLSGEGPRCGAL